MIEIVHLSFVVLKYFSLLRVVYTTQLPLKTQRLTRILIQNVCLLDVFLDSEWITPPGENQ